MCESACDHVWVHVWVEMYMFVAMHMHIIRMHMIHNSHVWVDVCGWICICSHAYALGMRGAVDQKEQAVGPAGWLVPSCLAKCLLPC